MKGSKKLLKMAELAKVGYESYVYHEAGCAKDLLKCEDRSGQGSGHISSNMGPNYESVGRASFYPQGELKSIILHELGGGCLLGHVLAWI
jgi:hypothetical protein